MSPQQTNWEDYDSNVFVGRKTELDKIKDWANASRVDKRLWAIVAPAGMGKTWFLQAAQEKLRGHVSPSQRLVFFIEIPKLVKPGVGLDNDAILKRLGEIQQDARKVCPEVRAIDPAATMISQNIDRLINDLCLHCDLHPTPIVVVDGYEEVEEKIRQDVDEQILERFFNRPECIRMLIALRDEGSIDSFVLRKNQCLPSLPLDALADPTMQFSEFVKKHYPQVQNLTFGQLKALPLIQGHESGLPRITSYNWDHPYINAFLFNRALSRAMGSPASVLTRNDISECISNLIRRPDQNGHSRYMPLTLDVLGCLTKIAQSLDKEWTSDELESLDLDINDDRINQVFQYGIIFNSTNSAQRYKVSDGLWELLRL
ncbi:hypothetical protein ANRL3_00951 [Anaerolineae bacterium]|nr:hypothetical protein ANRL3_00951 [Anaerolineae bacterium]